VSGAPRAVVFDCDGLLIDSEVRWAVAERRVVETLGGEWTAELRERMVGGSGDNTAREIAAWVGLPESAAEDVLRDVYTGYLAVLDELGVEQMQGAHTVVSAVAGRLPLAVASNTREATVRATLAASGLPAVFDLVFTPDQGRRPKPDPDVYLAACEALGVAPADAVAFEDSAPGAAAARAAGMFVIAVPSEGIHELDADLVLGSLLDLDLAVLGLEPL
jgi:beta-phosphoglucomutase-like phosphatase (HAD superfamily)